MKKLFEIINGWLRYFLTPMTKEEMEKIEICHNCPLRKGFLCGDCGCVIVAKIKCSICSCPQGKW